MGSAFCARWAVGGAGATVRSRQRTFASRPQLKLLRHLGGHENIVCILDASMVKSDVYIVTDLM